jgi:hypothetical protein
MAGEVGTQEIISPEVSPATPARPCGREHVWKYIKIRHRPHNSCYVLPTGYGLYKKQLFDYTVKGKGKSLPLQA